MDLNHQKTNEQFHLNYNYKLYKNKKIGNGAFGKVYLGLNTENKKYIAIKMENCDNDNINNSQLKNEYNMLKYFQGIEGIPQVYLYKNIKNLNFLLMELLGSNLKFLLKKCNNHFSIKTIINLGIQMLERIEEIHKRHVIHRDIKPENFVMGLKENNNILYLIDFGLSKRFRNPKTGEHIKYKDGKKLVGTAKFSSIYTHLGIEQSRRDDLEGIFYTLIYLFKGNLPWENLKAKNKEEKYQKILSKKINYDIEQLCQNLPNFFPNILLYVRSLQFEEIPNYDYLKGFFIQEYNCKCKLIDLNFDWIEKNKFINENSSSLNDKQSKNQNISNLKKLRANIINDLKVNLKE
jgi:serine/threonine protein kinase